MTALLVGPLLRHVDRSSATVWVETDRPCEVRVLDRTARTFTVHGHHYALVEIDGLEPGSATEYEVALDGETVWPEPESPFPPSVIRTLGGDGPLKISFGSCRRSPDRAGAHGHDALSAYAHRLSAGADRPSMLLLVGDQVYADELGPEMRAIIRERREPGDEPQDEIADFEEYTHLYRLAWAEDPAVRWLLSTVPSLMVFDDHDVRDDWNTSHAWREQVAALPWWHRRIVGGLGSYWIYQHLGNLSSRERAEDSLYQAVQKASPEDASKMLDDFAERADKEPATTRWSYAHDFGGTRLVVVDSRCSRVLEPGRRAMFDEPEQRWLDERCTGDVDHLLIASSLPYLLPRAIHHGEAWNEALANGAWGRRAARFGEKLRQFADLEHWAAFDGSFRRLAEDVLAVSRGERGAAPASIAFLSGDVHYSYLARVTRGAGRTPISQVVCSPLRNPLIGKFRWANIIACVRGPAPLARAVAALARAPRPPLNWRVTDGPWFDNAIATVEIEGRTAAVRWERVTGATGLAEIARAELS
ncbi:alkaline phosphatase family protein [Actinomadura craniellae]|uniref:Alkaline phosphatase family protein n=1 Tax=Actinomadura craniellae TaxID=2231787 RepID=A0A365H3A2_9ACTN|nr:alkaline phosphatase D family protein [Actinomadura craniellae]RAY13577.1 alkaline phosphatase family protein [Actinomadura craniellae]